MSVLTLAASAQERRAQNKPYVDLRPLHFGILVGTHLQDIEFENVGPQTVTNADGTQTVQTITCDADTWNPGLTVGVLADWRISEHLNLRFTPVEGLVKPYVVIKREGVRIGVFGLSPVLEGLVSADNFAGVKYLDPIAKAKETVKTLKEKEKCDVVVCLSHLGWNMLPPDVDDAQLIKATSGIDLVLGGHSHTYMVEAEKVANAEGKEIIDDQNGKHALFVGKLTLAIQNTK